MTVTEWLIEECRRRLAIAEKNMVFPISAEAPGHTFVERIDDLPGRGFNVREYQKRRYRQDHGG